MRYEYLECRHSLSGAYQLAISIRDDVTLWTMRDASDICAEVLPGDALILIADGKPVHAVHVVDRFQLISGQVLTAVIVERGVELGGSNDCRPRGN